MPFVTNNYYNVHWKWGIDFSHLSIAPSQLWTDDDAVVLRFNYTDARELYNVGKWYQQQLQTPYIEAQPSIMTPETCTNGDYFHDKDNEYLFVCVSGKNKAIHEWIDLEGVPCVDECPEEEVEEGEREDFFRYWSDASNWPDSLKPTEGTNVSIPYEWKLVLDEDPPVLNYLKVSGILVFDPHRDNKLEAHYIWVTDGIIKIGS